MKAIKLRKSCIGQIIAAFLLLCAANCAQAALIITNDSNIVLETSQIESGGGTTPNPDVTGGIGGALVAYSESGVSFGCCGPSYLGDNLDDGDIGDGIFSDGFYAIPDSGDLRLTFDAGEVTLGGIAIYNGYTNRDDGSYTLLDDTGVILGAWGIVGTSGGTNSGADSFWLTFAAPVTTSYLTLEAEVLDCCNTASYREIQVFAAPASAVPEPAAIWLLLSGLTMLTGLVKAISFMPQLDRADSKSSEKGGKRGQGKRGKRGQAQLKEKGARLN